MRFVCYQIGLVARYETKMLFRSWFFRIFAGLSLGILLLTSIFLLVLPYSPYVFRALSASLPYLNLKLLNLFQAIMVIFLASEFLKRDQKYDSTEVIYARSISNSAYILGKVGGILVVFLSVNLLVICISLILHIFFAKVSFTLAPYLIYPLFFSLPTLIFGIGLTTFTMSLIRNQAVTFLLLLAYIGVAFFYLLTKAFFIFDFTALVLPSGYSDFIGLAISKATLSQRLAYLLLGLSLIGFTSARLRRLIQSTASHRVNLILASLLLLLAGGAFRYYYHSFQRVNQTRDELRKINQKWGHYPTVQIDRVRLAVEKHDAALAVTAHISFTNANSEAIHRYLFSLNSGLNIQSVHRAGEKLASERSTHLLWITPSQPLSPGHTDSLTIQYAGEIQETEMYLDTPADQWHAGFAIWLYRFQKKPAILTPNYWLLTGESAWYPIAGLPYGVNYPHLKPRDFIQFDLEATVPERFTVISQAVPTIRELKAQHRRQFHFRPESALSQMSLIIGEYQPRSLVVDSIRYTLFTRPGHAYFETYLDSLGDTLATLIRDTKNDYEVRMGLTYPFKYLNLVETPIQYYVYPRPWTLAAETVLPATILLPESGMLLDAADFRQMKDRMEQPGRRSGMVFTQQERQAQMVQNFLTTDLAGLNQVDWSWRSQEGLANLNYQVFPNYFYHANHFYSPQWSIFNQLLESFIYHRLPSGRPAVQRYFEGLSPQEKANQALVGRSLEQVLADTASRQVQLEIVKNKGIDLFLSIACQVGERDFNHFLTSYIVQNRFRKQDAADFLQTLKQNFQFDFMPDFTRCYTDTLLARFQISHVSGEKIMAQQQTQFQSRLFVENLATTPGLLELQFFGEIERSQPGRNPIPAPLKSRLIRVLPKTRLEIGMVLTEIPRRLEINTFVSQNLPVRLNFNFSPDDEIVKNRVPFDRIQVSPHVLADSVIEIIVDNEDPGFQMLTQTQKSPLQKLLRPGYSNQEKYHELRYWNPPGQWVATIHENFYGEYIHSAYAIKAGKGEQKVAWYAQIQSTGWYEVYYYPGKIAQPNWYRRRRRKNNTPEILHFQIKHDDGIESVELNLAETELDWSYLGNYYFSAGTAHLTLTNESNAPIVFADAVKWRKK